MKNSQRGFVVPLLIGSIAILIIASGTYIYLQKHKKVEVALEENKTATSSNQIVASNKAEVEKWKSYTYPIGSVQFEYPSNYCIFTSENIELNASEVIVANTPTCPKNEPPTLGSKTSAMQMAIQPARLTGTLDQWKKQIIFLNKNTDNVIKDSYIEIGGQDAVMIIQKHTGPSIYTTRGNKAYIIHLLPADSDILNKIITSIKFTN